MIQYQPQNGSTMSPHPILDPNALCTESAFIALDPRQSDMQSLQSAVFEVTAVQRMQRCMCKATLAHTTSRCHAVPN